MTENGHYNLIEEFIEMIREIRGGQLKVPDKDVAVLSLTRDMGLDSLDIINFLFRVEERHVLKIPEEDINAKDLIVLGNLASYIATHKGAGA